VSLLATSHNGFSEKILCITMTPVAEGIQAGSNKLRKVLSTSIADYPQPPKWFQQKELLCRMITCSLFSSA